MADINVPTTELPEIIGEDLLQSGYTKDFDDVGQETTVISWEGRRDKVEAEYEAQKILSKEDDITGSMAIRDGNGTLDVTSIAPTVDDPGDNDGVSVVWQVVFQEVMKNIGTHPYFTDTVDSNWVTTQVRIDQAIKNNIPLDVEQFVLANEAKRYYALRSFGVDTYPVYQPIIKKTTKMAKASIIVPSFKGFGYIQTIKEIDPPIWLIKQLSNLPKVKKTDYSVVNDILTINPSTIALTNYEWVKLPPTVSSTAGSKQYDINEIWRGAEKWSTVFYGGSWDPKAEGS